MKVLAIANQKGGVGKTTTTVNLGAALAGRGHSCVVVDMDPQANLTTSLDLRLAEDDLSVYDALVDGESFADTLLETRTPNLLACPSEPSLAGADLELAADEPDPQCRASRLRDSLEAFAATSGSPDFILLDCPPSLGLLTVNALVAADGVLIPMQCEFFAMEGLARLLETVRRIRAAWNPDLELLGVCFTMVDRRTNLSRQVIAEVKREFGQLVLRSEVPRSIRVAEAPSFGLPLHLYDPRGKAAVAYSDLAGEVLRR